MSAFRWLSPATGYLQGGYTHTLNPYAGCRFGCSYCYVRRLPVALLGGAPWGEWVRPKSGDPGAIRGELIRAKRKGPVAVFMSSATDPYQPVEAKARITRRLLEAMAEEPPDFLLVQTRSPLVVRDADLFRRLGGRVLVSVTVETDLEEMRRALTPGAPPLAARFKALRRLREEGIPVQAAVSPLLPYSPRFVDRLAEAAPRIVADDYFRGDGSRGVRSRLLGMPERYAALGLSDWYRPEVLERFAEEALRRFPPDAVGISAAGFAPPSRPGPDAPG
ncbi:MAG TPA: radical SAM protein [Paenibacillaceae bacterium]